MTDLWYEEFLNFSWEEPQISEDSSNFTQLIWFESREVGIGKASSKSGYHVVVAKYSPPGNQPGTLLIRNVRRRGLERGSVEPTVFVAKLKVSQSIKSPSSGLSWEAEGEQIAAL